MYKKIFLFAVLATLCGSVSAEQAAPDTANQIQNSGAAVNNAQTAPVQPAEDAENEPEAAPTVRGRDENAGQSTQQGANAGTDMFQGDHF